MIVQVSITKKSRFGEEKAVEHIYYKNNFGMWRLLNWHKNISSVRIICQSLSNRRRRTVPVYWEMLVLKSGIRVTHVLV